MRTSPLTALSLLVAAIAFSGCIGADSPAAQASSPADSSNTASDASGSDAPTGESNATSGSDAPSGTPDPSQEPVPKNNTAPNATLEASAVTGVAPLAVTFTVNGTDADGDALSWVLDADGDGSEDANGTAVPATFDYTFDAEGQYTAFLTISDGEANATANVTVSVEPAVVVDPCPTQTATVTLNGYYLVVDSPTDASIWIYQESNGKPGLQRNDDYLTTGCPTPDTIIF